MLALDLDWPPTVNTYYRNVRGRMLISAKGRQYRENVTADVLSTGVRHGLTCRLKVSVVAYPPDNRKRDIDNLLKPLLDALMHAGVIQDDSQIDDLRIVRGEKRKGGAVEVFVERAE